MLRKKVQAMGRIGKIYSTLKEEHVLLLKMKQMAPDGRLPKGLLLEGRPAIKKGGKRAPPGGGPPARAQLASRAPFRRVR